MFRESVSALMQVADPQLDEVVVRLESGGGMVHSYGLASAQFSQPSSLDGAASNNDDDDDDDDYDDSDDDDGNDDDDKEVVILGRIVKWLDFIRSRPQTSEISP